MTIQVNLSMISVIMPFEEQVDNWFNEILEAVGEYYIIRKWLGYLRQLNPTVRYHEISKYLDPEYQLDDWRDETWMTCERKTELIRTFPLLNGILHHK